MLALLTSTIWALALLFVYVDTRLYGIFRYHFNGLVWNVLTTPGADEAVHLSGHEGASLLAPPGDRARVVAGWDTLGVHVDGAILSIPMAGYGGGEITVYDAGWQPVFDDSALLARLGRALGTLALECRRFLR